MDDDAIIQKARDADCCELVERLPSIDHASGKKYSCPVCPSTDALHPRDEVAVCYSARHPGSHEGTPMDAIELVEEARGCGFVAAVEWITGMVLDGDDTTHDAPPIREPKMDDRDEGDVKVRLEPTTAVLEAIIRSEKTDLSDAGAAYLEDRAISRATAQRMGIVDFTRQEWGAWIGDVPEPSDPDIDIDELLEASGVVIEGDDGEEGRLHPYYDHFLAIPYWGPDEWTFGPDGAAWCQQGKLETVRFRTTSKAEKPKMMSLTSRGPSTSSVPYLQASVGAAGRYSWPLFVVEGELDALSIWEAIRWPVVATNSAHRWPREWCEGWVQPDTRAVAIEERKSILMVRDGLDEDVAEKRARHRYDGVEMGGAEASHIPDVIVIAEGDEGGRRFADLVNARVAEVHGDAFASRRVRSIELSGGRDVNDLLVDGRLTECLDGLLEKVDEMHEGCHPMHRSGEPSAREWGGSREGVL